MSKLHNYRFYAQLPVKPVPAMMKVRAKNEKEAIRKARKSVDWQWDIDYKLSTTWPYKLRKEVKGK